MVERPVHLPGVHRDGYPNVRARNDYYNDSYEGAHDPIGNRTGVLTMADMVTTPRKKKKTRAEFSSLSRMKL